MNVEAEIMKLKSQVKRLEHSKESYWMTAEEVVREVGVSIKTVYKWSSERKFTTTNRGGLKFKREEIMEWINGGTKAKAA